MATKRIAGTAYVKVGADQIPLRGNLTSSLVTSVREGIAGQDDVHGYKEMPRTPFIEGDFTIPRGFDVEQIADWEDVTVTAEYANGMVHTLRNAWSAGEIDYDAVEGQATIRFEGLSIEPTRSSA